MDATSPPPARRPTIALLTDFGLQDHYVGVMKAVIADGCPDATVIDITHEVPPQDVATAAYELAAAAPYFPAGTVFLAVVDPGVGTDRPSIAAQVGAHRFVGPDNGVFDLVFQRESPILVVELGQAHASRAQSRTFEGRDRFAPAAAWLAQGRPLESLGRRTSAALRREWPKARASTIGVDGEVVHVDRFGNLITNIERGDLAPLGPLSRVSVGSHGQVPLVGTYGEGRVGELVALLNSADRLEIAVVSGHAARRLGAGRGALVRVCGVRDTMPGPIEDPFE